MKDYHQTIRLFQKTTDNADIYWYETSNEYLDFHKLFMTLRIINVEDLWIVYEHFGDMGNFYDATETNYFSRHFRVTGSANDSGNIRTKEELENYLETVNATDVYLLREFKYHNDLYKDKKEELHEELYQSDLDERIKSYLSVHNITDSIFIQRDGHQFVGG